MTDRPTPAICASAMCLDFANTAPQMAQLNAAGIEFLHIDIMDGHFVPNLTFGPDIVRTLRGLAPMPLDFHLMVTEPERFMDMLDILPGDLVSVHAESTRHAQRLVARIRALGARPLIALNPATPLIALSYLLDDIDGVLVMTVNPGYAGQALVPATLEKIAGARAMLDGAGKHGLHIQVDGNVSFENARRMRSQGADMFVAGSSSVFHQGGDIKGNTARLREAIGAV